MDIGQESFRDLYIEVNRDTIGAVISMPIPNGVTIFSKVSIQVRLPEGYLSRLHFIYQKHPQNSEPLAIFSEIPLRYRTDNVKIALFLHTLVFHIGSKHECLFNRYKTSVIERGSKNVDTAPRPNTANN